MPGLSQSTPPPSASRLLCCRHWEDAPWSYHGDAGSGAGGAGRTSHPVGFGTGLFSEGFLPDTRLPEPPPCQCPGPWMMTRAPGISASNGDGDGDAARAFSRTRPQQRGACRLCPGGFSAARQPPPTHPGRQARPLGTASCGRLFYRLNTQTRTAIHAKLQQEQTSALRTQASVCLASAGEPSLVRASKVKANGFCHVQLPCSEVQQGHITRQRTIHKGNKTHAAKFTRIVHLQQRSTPCSL